MMDQERFQTLKSADIHLQSKQLYEYVNKQKNHKASSKQVQKQLYKSDAEEKKLGYEKFLSSLRNFKYYMKSLYKTENEEQESNQKQIIEMQKNSFENYTQQNQEQIDFVSCKKINHVKIEFNNENTQKKIHERSNKSINYLVSEYNNKIKSKLKNRSMFLYRRNTNDKSMGNNAIFIKELNSTTTYSTNGFFRPQTSNNHIEFNTNKKNILLHQSERYKYPNYQKPKSADQPRFNIIETSSIEAEMFRNPIVRNVLKVQNKKYSKIRNTTAINIPVQFYRSQTRHNPVSLTSCVPLKTRKMNAKKKKLILINPFI